MQKSNETIPIGFIDDLILWAEVNDELEYAECLETLLEDWREYKRRMTEVEE